MKPNEDIYNQIPPLPSTIAVVPVDEGKAPVFFQHFPGVYCRGCGATFALYSYSMDRPHGLDEEGKPYYNSCFKCEKEGGAK